MQSNRTDRHVFNITDQKNVTREGFTIRDASAALSTIGNDIVKGQEISALGESRRNIRRSSNNDSILYSGRHIPENCFIDNEPQAWDDGTDNNWIGNYWSPPSGGSSNYIIPGAAGSEDKDPLDECPMKEQST